ncbi:hypothetical protein [Gordonia neofelifaecis]|uniref:Uncharacterized protein n=1 Tax=Gordonia neofelifaecis NRRL B-59395 TaxID=644548 RepID=F1YJV1_9ACTN|nr:hypothetical protein [Gordonia neofelifaecis]EGD55033.1 hypothetical protein SCNU_10906 [Gordonia neofelifaecis NRRL B-59395]
MGIAVAIGVFLFIIAFTVLYTLLMRPVERIADRILDKLFAALMYPFVALWKSFRGEPDRVEPTRPPVPGQSIRQGPYPAPQYPRQDPPQYVQGGRPMPNPSRQAGPRPPHVRTAGPPPPASRPPHAVVPAPYPAPQAPVRHPSQPPYGSAR